MPGQNLVFPSYDAVGEPADDTETVIGRLTGVSTIFDGQPVYLYGWAAITPAADATSVIFGFRRTDLSGTVVGGVEIPVTVDAAGDPQGSIFTCHVMDLPGNAQNATYALTATIVDATDPSPIDSLYVEARVG